MRDLSRGLKGLRRDLAKTQAAISVMEQALRQLAAMTDRVDGSPRHSLRQQLIHSIRERLASARATQSSIAWLMEECGGERKRRAASDDTSADAEGTYGVLIRAANCGAV